MKRRKDYFKKITKSIDQKLDQADILVKTHTHKAHRKTKRIRHWIRIPTWFVMFFLVSGISIITGCLIWVASLEIPDIETINTVHVPESTKIYDRNSVLLYSAYSDARRTIVPFDEMSDHLKKAHIAIEDEEFYEHIGIDFTAIGRALVTNVKNRDLLGGQGGSTITQQVIKNSLLTQERTIIRKTKEWILSLRLERIWEKDKILETYLNISPYGGSIYGVEEASQYYFGKKSKDVSVAEAAYLASLPKAPTYYSPYGEHREDLDKRQQSVLRKMRANNFITNQEYTEAREEEVVFLEGAKESILAPHFVFYVLKQLGETYGEDLVKEGGYDVYTTLDYTLQKKAEELVKKFALNNTTRSNATNAAMVITDPKSGEILVMVGSRDYWDETIEGEFNIATALRQPGSTFKPIAYSTAFEKGFTPDTILFDLQTQFNPNCPATQMDKEDGCYAPRNSSWSFVGPITMRDALAQSRNVTAVKALYLAGLQKTLDNALKMGLTSLNKPANYYGLPLVLGGGEVRMVDLVSVFGTYANEGIYRPHTPILRIENNKGEVIEEHKNDSGERIFSTETMRQLTSVLTDNNARLGYFSPQALVVPGVNPSKIAVKTGTTNDNRDVWVMSYTPRMTLGVWAGNNNNASMKLPNDGQGIVVPLWKDAVAEFMESFPQEDFTKPQPIKKTNKPILHGNWKGGSTYNVTTVSATGEEIVQQKSVNNVHNILHWVNKSNPAGPAPSRPSSDDQYKNWEAVVQNWYKGQQPSAPKPKTFQSNSSQPSSLEIIPFSIKSTYKSTDNLSLIFKTNKIDSIQVDINGQPVTTISGSQPALKIPISSISSLAETNTILLSGKDTEGKVVQRSYTFAIND